MSLIKAIYPYYKAPLGITRRGTHYGGYKKIENYPNPNKKRTPLTKSGRGFL